MNRKAIIGHYPEKKIPEHGLFYSWIPTMEKDSNGKAVGQQNFLVSDNWASFDAFIKTTDEATQALYDQKLVYSLTTEGKSSVFNEYVQMCVNGDHPDNIESAHEYFMNCTRGRQVAKAEGKDFEISSRQIKREPTKFFKSLEIVHYNPETPEICLRSKHEFDFERARGICQMKATFNTLTQEQLDAQVKVHTKRHEYTLAGSILGHFGGTLLFPGSKLEISSDKKMFWIMNNTRVEQVKLSFRSPLLKHTDKPMMTQLTSDAIKNAKASKSLKNYVEAHTFIAKDASVEFGAAIPKSKQVNNITSVFPYQRKAYKDQDIIVPNKVGSVQLIFPYDFEYCMTQDPDDRFYCPKISDYNDETSNHSAPYYPETELMVSFINGNINKPIIRGALAHENTANLDTQNHPNRHYHQMDQGSKFGYTSDRTQKEGNSLFFKSDHANYAHSSFINLSNVTDPKTAGKERHLDHITATTANRTERTKGEHQESYGIDPTGKTDKPNQFKHVKPAREINQKVAPIQDVGRVKQEAQNRAQAKQQIILPMTSDSEMMNNLSVQEGFAGGQLNIKGFEYSQEGLSGSGQKMQITMSITGQVDVLENNKKVTQEILEQNRDEIKAHLEASVHNVFAKVEVLIHKPLPKTIELGVKAKFGNSDLTLSIAPVMGESYVFNGTSTLNVNYRGNDCLIQGNIILDVTASFEGKNKKGNAHPDHSFMEDYADARMIAKIGLDVVETGAEWIGGFALAYATP